jgi:hypothetical protein
MHRWNGTLIMDDNILSLDIVCADEYPHKPPQARFSPPIQWDGAEADGTVRESFGAAHGRHVGATSSVLFSNGYCEALRGGGGGERLASRSPRQ